MKVVLLAGGFGTRISEESQFKPKPMIEIGGMPILWHIMKEYAYYGHTEFIICAGYKQEYIKEWFANYFLHESDVTFDYRDGKSEMTVHQSQCEPWRVTVVDTGYNTMTGGRIKRIQKYIGNEPFFMTYGDGVCDVDINKLLEFHQGHGKIATLTAVKIAQDKGILNIGVTMLSRVSVRRTLPTGHPSMPAIWSWNQRFSIIWKTIPPSLRKNQWSSLSRKGSLCHIPTRDSGNVWTMPVNGICWKSYCARDMLPGKSGDVLNQSL